MNGLRKWVGRLVTVAGMAAVIVGALLAIWLPQFAEPGHHFDATQIPVAIMFTGLIVSCLGYTIHGWGEPW